MRYRILASTLAMLFCVPVSAVPKYFGYFANEQQAENQEHTNITHIYTGEDDYPLSTWDAKILSELAKAKGYGNKAVVSMGAYVFDTADKRHFKVDPFAAAQFNALVDKLIAGGYLVPGNPEASTVAAFYPVDEPAYRGLPDVGGAANPALANALSVMRANPAVANFPIAVIDNQDYAPAIQGIRLFDWAGLDHYPGNDGDYRNALTEFTSRLRPEQKLIIVPQAALGNNGLDYSYHNPEYMHFLSQAYASTIMLMPFRWAGDPPVIGTRDIPALRSSYTSIGYQVKYGLYASYVGTSVPTSMTAGQYYAVNLSFNNNSDKTWRAGTNINLGYPGDSDTWGLHRVALPYDVGPYQNVTFAFTVRAPSAPGQYSFQWQMVADSMAWFGTASPATTIYVAAAASGSIGANPNPCSIPYGGSTCNATISWNSNRADAEVWASAPNGSGAQLFARAQNASQNAPWITTGTTRFTLKSGGVPITYVDVYGVQASEPPPWEPPPHCPKCVEP